MVTYKSQGGLRKVLGVKTFLKFLFLQNFFDSPASRRASRRWAEQNVDSRPKSQLNGAEAPFLFCPETQSWCVIKQKAQHSIRPIPEKRDHTQENKKSLAKKSDLEKFLLLELNGGKNVFSKELTQES